MYDKVLNDIKEARNRRLSGKQNCIPWGMSRLEYESPGIEQGTYYLVTGNTKGGKTQITDHMFVYQPYDYITSNPTCGISLKIFYFTLEMDVKSKIRQNISRKLFVDSNKDIRIQPKELLSKSASSILSSDVLEKIEDMKPYFEQFQEVVTYIDHIKHPYGIYKYMSDYAKSRGIQHKKKINIDGNDVLVDDYYEAYDPNEYVIIIIDHASLIYQEKGHKSKYEAINDLSTKYLITLRNKYNHIPVLVQQQNMDKQGLDSIKMNRMYPTVDSLSDNKHTAKDCDVAFGIYSPYSMKVKSYAGYDITKLKDFSRFLEIIISRQGGASSITPLFFDGAVNYFTQLPNPKDTTNINKIYSYLSSKGL